MAEQCEARLAELAAKYAPDVDRDKAERAERLATKPKPAFGESLRTARRVRAAERAIKEARPEIVSAPDARTMRPEDIANIAALTPGDARAILSRLAIVCPGALHKAMEQTGQVWGGWADDDVRWTLTPHELRSHATL